MQNDIEQGEAERRARTIEVTLINSNETTRRVLEACRRIQWRWHKPVEDAEESNHDDL
jgi:hypothetical protein